MKDIINLIGQEQILRHILFDEAIILAPGKVLDIGQMTSDEVINRDNPVTFGQEAISQMRAKKTCTASNDGNGLLFVDMGGHRGLYLNARRLICEQKELKSNFCSRFEVMFSIECYALDFPRHGFNFELTST